MFNFKGHTKADCPLLYFHFIYHLEWLKQTNSRQQTHAVLLIYIMSFIKFSCMTRIMGGVILNIATLMSSLVFSSLTTLVIQWKASHVAISWFSPPFTGQARIYKSFNGMYSHPDCHFLLSALQPGSDAEHTCFTAHLLPAFGVKSRAWQSHKA